MKKNVFMRAALLMLVLTLITSCFVGGTFAKYTTDGTIGANSARVAKWGVSFALANENSLFNTTYAENNDLQTAGVSVKSSTADNVVAPGTEGETITYNVTGTPEVSYKVTFTITEAETVWLKNGENTYEPIVWTWTLNGDETEGTLEEMLAAVNAFTFYFNVDDGKYYVNGAAQETAPSVEINWAWGFETSNDANDTRLGDLAAGAVAAEGETSNLNVSFILSANATQLD